MTPEQLKAKVHEVVMASASRARSDDAFMEFLRAMYSDNELAEITGNEMCLSMLHQFWLGGLAYGRRLQ